jgi:hypothetical protein
MSANPTPTEPAEGTIRCRFCREMTIADAEAPGAGWYPSVFVDRTDGTHDEVGPICPGCIARLGVREDAYGEMVIAPARYLLPVGW